jgi:hypothetical protein
MQTYNFMFLYTDLLQRHHECLKAHCKAKMKKSQVYEWYKNFRDGRASVNDEPHSRRSSTSTNDENMDSVCTAVRGDQPEGNQQISVEVGISARSVYIINSMAWVRERTMQTERRPLVGRSYCLLSAERGCHVVSLTDPYGRILGFLDRSRYFFFQVAPQLYSRVWVNRVPDPLLLRKSGSAKNWARISGSVAWNSDH